MPTLTAGPASLQIDAASGGRLSSLVAHGHELLVPRPGRGEAVNPLGWGCYPMVPYAGRVRGGCFRWDGASHRLPRNLGAHAAHGTLVDRPWQVERAEGATARLRAELGPPWPFTGHAIQELTLRPDSLELRLEVHAHDVAFPATAGWHPWFRRQLERGGAVVLDVRAARFYPRDADGLPTGTVTPAPPSGPWDDCFTEITWPVRLTWPDALELTVTSTCDHVVVFDEPAHAVCVEPQSGPPDALNLGRAHVVRPGEPFVAEAALRWHPTGHQ